MRIPNIKTNGLALLNTTRPGWVLPVLVALYITFFFNTHIYPLVTLFHPIEKPLDVLFFASITFVMFYLVHFIAAALSVGKWQKGWLIFLLVISAGISYIRSEFNVLFDETMIQNVVETDVHEASELVSISWVFHIILFGCVPAFILSKIPVKKQTLTKDILHRFFTISLLTVVLLLSIFPFLESYASLLRSNRSLKENIVPTAFLHSTYLYFKNTLPVSQRTLTTIGTDAVMPEQLKSGKKIVMVIVVGETARTANFSLAGYPRQTNPLLQERSNSKKDILFYPEFYSCGTTTSISVPCMFSASTRSDFNSADEDYRENLLDVLVHAGLEVLWIDNNSGCKGVCARITYKDMRGRTDDPSCNRYGCSDKMLVEDLEEKINSSHENIVIVLHQKGSHGPAYYERIPKDKEIFTPVCRTSQLQKCAHADIVNSYDNTIVYTDFILDGIIKTLEKHNTERDTVMFYVSDHGESLGENGLYLHGMPYSIAPDTQKHIPAILWLSQGFQQRMNIDFECLRTHSVEKYSHDNMFHTMLGLLNIKTSVYNSQYDISKPCRKTH